MGNYISGFYGTLDSIKITPEELIVSKNKLKKTEINEKEAWIGPVSLKADHSG